MIKLRPYQEELIVGARTHFRQGRKRVLLQLATGGGKTAICSRMLHNAVERGKRAWFNCHRRELVAQISKALTLEGVPHGLVTADAPMNLAAPVQVCSIPTLANRTDRLPPPDLIAWDEVHHIAAGTWARMMDQFRDIYHIGLSATPSRLDGAGLGDYFDAMVCGPSARWLIDNGYLSGYRLFAPSSIDTSGLHKRMGEYITAEAVELVNKPKITGDAISHYRKHGDGGRFLLFSPSIEHSKAVSLAFNAAGIPSLHVDGKTDSGLRDDMMADFDAGKILIMCNVDLFSEGVDVPALDGIIDLAPTMSLTKVMQRWGRALRTYPGKSHAVLLDHVGNSLLHGLPDDERSWELTCGKPEKKKTTVPPPKVCAKCFAASPAYSQRCKVCGEGFPVDGRQIEQVDGELSEVEMTPEQRERRQAHIQQGRTRDLQGLIELGRIRGMKNPEGWAGHVIAAREAKQRRAG